MTTTTGFPLNPLRMYYCTADEQIAYTNALNAESTMNNNGALDVQAINMGNNDHGGCILLLYLQLLIVPNP